MKIQKRAPAPEPLGEKGKPPTSIAQKQEELKRTIIELYDERVWFLTEACLSVLVSCVLSDLANPLALILVGPPSDGKTTVLNFFEKLPMSYRIDKFTPASFLTQSANVKKKDLKDVDLLPKIPYKTLLVPEMAPLFNLPKETLRESYALLATLFDGRGLVRGGAIHGARNLTGDYPFGLLGATTPLTQAAWKTMGKLGSRMVFLHDPSNLSKADRRKRAKEIMTSPLHYRHRGKMARDAIATFLEFLFKQFDTTYYKIPEDVPENLTSIDLILEHCGYLPRCLDWNKDNDDESTVDTIAYLAEFLTSARSDVGVWTEKAEDGHRETNSTGVILEGVDRFTAIIYNLARSHAIISGRNGINSDDLPLLVDVTISSLPDVRRRVIELLIDPKIEFKRSQPGEFTINELRHAISCSDKTAMDVMKRLETIGIGRIKVGTGRKPTLFKLNNYYDWLITHDFQQYYHRWDKSKSK